MTAQLLGENGIRAEPLADSQWDMKLIHATAHGCPLGWLIHPYQKTIDVYRPGRPPERLAPDAVLEGEPVLPGFRLPASEVFGWLKRPGRRPQTPPGPGMEPA